MLSNYYDDAKETLEKIITGNMLIAVTSFESGISNQLVLDTYSIEHFGSNDSDRANIKLFLQYWEYVPTETGFDKQLRMLNLVVLNSEADTRWTKNMIRKVWVDGYPSSVALDTKTGEVYLVYIREWGLELQHYANMALNKLEGFLLTIKENEPYYIYIKDTAMFDVIDGAEGYRHLLRNTYIYFNGVTPTKVAIGERPE